MRLILSDDDIAEGLDALVAADPRLLPVRAVAGPVAVRHRPPGFEGVARIVVAQMLSVASAEAIWRKLEGQLGPVTVESFLAATPEQLRAAGLSGGKIRTLTGLAEAAAGGLDLCGLAERPPEEAVAALVALPGIGVWTAEIFLLFCARHADVFPAGDLALQVAAAEGLALPGRPKEKEMRVIAEAWAPWRGVAAKLLWAYYKAVREGRTALPV
jgi:DNA-3-methyladenine glycosylase II